MRRREHLRVGRAQVKITKPSHVPGVRQGNAIGSLEKESGLRQRGAGAFATGRRSTGINAEAREPIDPRMPVLTPP